MEATRTLDCGGIRMQAVTNYGGGWLHFSGAGLNKVLAPTVQFKANTTGAGLVGGLVKGETVPATAAALLDAMDEGVAVADGSAYEVSLARRALATLAGV